MMAWLSDWWSGGTAVVEPASLRDAARLAQLHGASFHRGWGEGEFEAVPHRRARSHAENRSAGSIAVVIGSTAQLATPETGADTPA